MLSAPELCFVSYWWREPSWAYRGWATWSSEPAHEASPGCPELGVDSILFPWCSLCGRSHRVFPYPFQCVVLSVEGTLSLDWIRVGCFNEYLENGINSNSNLGDLEQSWLSSRDTSLITYLQDLRGHLVSENDNESLAFICVCERCLQFPEGTDFRCNGKEEAKTTALWKEHGHQNNWSEICRAGPAWQLSFKLELNYLTLSFSLQTLGFLFSVFYILITVFEDFNRWKHGADLMNDCWLNSRNRDEHSAYIVTKRRHQTDLLTSSQIYRVKQHCLILWGSMHYFKATY